MNPQESPLFENFDFQTEINVLVDAINTSGKAFVLTYFDMLKANLLSQEQELIVIDFAIQTIKADGVIEYSEIKFFKNIRHRLQISDENILAVYPDIEQFLEDDIVTGSFLDRITNQYLESADLPQFSLININSIE